MKNAQKPDHISLGTLIGNLTAGRFVIPDFQRDFEWTPQDVRDLMRSIFLDYYIGSLLLWKGKPATFEALACEPVYAYAGDQSNPEHIVLDGQQRLTAMYYAFVAPDKPAPNRANRVLYFVNVKQFMAEAYDDAFHYDWKKSALSLAQNQTAQFRSHMFPLSVMGSGGWDLANWVQGYERYWQDAAEAAEDPERAAEAKRFAEDAKRFGILLKDLTEQYQIAYVQLDEDLELDKVCDIFTQVNSKGVRLDVFDLINALVKPRGLQLKHMWREAAPKLAFVSTGSMNVYVLQVMSILTQAYCSPKYLYFLLPGQEKTVRDSTGTLSKQVLVKSTEEFESLWQTSVAALERAIGLLRHPQTFGAISPAYLPYVSILPAFAALEHRARALPPAQVLDARKKIEHWYWASVFLSRYSGSVESTAARDFTEVSAWFEDSAKEPALVGEFQQRFKTIPLRTEVKRGSSIYNGVFNLLVISEARDWMTGDVPQHGDLDDHHIVPRDWAKDKDLATPIDTILNRTPLTGATNRHVISNRLPCQYLPELIEKNGESTVRATLESHLISPAAFDILLRDPFGPDDFEAFIAERQRTIQEAIEDLLVKERLGLAPQLRELDVQIEDIELKLRGLIDETLAGDVASVPSHVREKVSLRVDAAVQKSATGTIDGYAKLAGQLEFFDLRELQDTITNKSLWPQFEERFKSKEALTGHFNHLADLRNAIRHSRTVDEITRTYGEGAILWFRQALATTSET